MLEWLSSELPSKEDSPELSLKPNESVGQSGTCSFQLIAKAWLSLFVISPFAPDIPNCPALFNALVKVTFPGKLLPLKMAALAVTLPVSKMDCESELSWFRP